MTVDSLDSGFGELATVMTSRSTRTCEADAWSSSGVSCISWDCAARLKLECMVDWKGRSFVNGLSSYIGRHNVSELSGTTLSAPGDTIHYGHRLYDDQYEEESDGAAPGQMNDGI